MSSAAGKVERADPTLEGTFLEGLVGIVRIGIDVRERSGSCSQTEDYNTGEMHVH